MTLDEMQTCAAETLKYFINVMPDAPFGEDDIVIEFAPKNKMAQRIIELAAIYAPDKTINESQRCDIAQNVAANAIIGRGKSAVVACVNPKNTEQDWRQIFFHEFTHIFCGKLENSESFMDTFGNGYTPEKDMTPDERTYDGWLNAGYVVWTEFIAHYYSFKYTENPYDLCEAQHSIQRYVTDVRFDSPHAKGSFSYACALFLNARDAAAEYCSLSEEHSDTNDGRTFYACLGSLHDKLREDKPWLLTEKFIADLGVKYVMYLTVHSMFC